MNTKNKSGHLYDIANFVVKHTLQSSEIFNCLKLTWIPDPKYDFPIRAEGRHNRKFQSKYLEIFPWSAYSEINKGAYCKWCVVFAFSGGGSGNQSLKNLVREPMTNQRAKDFLKNYENGDQTAVNVLLSNQKREIIEHYCKRLIPIIKTILFCARNNLPLRGHRESGSLKFDNVREDCLSGNQGIFRALLSFRMESGDRDLKSHFDISAKNCTMISSTIQNEIIESMGSFLSTLPVTSATPERTFSILKKIKTYLRSTISQERLNGLALTNINATGIIKTNMQMLQASALVIIMNPQKKFELKSVTLLSIEQKQALVLFMQELLKATFIPCTAHSLNLAGVNAASSNVQMKNFFGKIQQLFNFFSGSPSRWEELKSLKLTLKPFSDTRWSSKSVAIKAVFIQLPEVKNALNNIIEKGNAESIFLDKSLLLFIDYEFICLLSIWNAILSSIDRVNVCLQSKSLTINKAANLIKGLINEITDLRTNRPETLFQSAEELTQKIATVFPQKE
ncbi:uncharacterized protein LOC132953621 [Metopolophium dirhodum]|uniref:uncharacterized protein LOC132953621 n=1 Tax=Metopolophium dirhodum TaxID=44670 RepID=UPI00299078FE|nr:uncharacterized protein LOC132953621 [Metopolophium dirhodum]